MLRHTVGCREGCEVAVPHGQILATETKVIKSSDWAALFPHGVMR